MKELCGDLPEPIEITMGGYTASVQEIRGFYHLSLTQLGEPYSLINSWCTDHHSAIALGRALIIACRPTTAPLPRVGWRFDVGKTSFVGWILFRGKQPQMIPSVVGQASGYELGRALLQLGLMMKMRREMALWLGAIAAPKSKAG